MSEIVVSQKVTVDVPWPKVDEELRQWFERWALSRGGTIPQPRHWTAVEVTFRSGSHGDITSVRFTYEPASPRTSGETGEQP